MMGTNGLKKRKDGCGKPTERKEMKTLDEVITMMEDERRCDVPMYKDDALYYMKAYKEMIDSFIGVVVQYKEFFKMIIDEAEK